MTTTILINQCKGGEFRVDDNCVMRYGNIVCILGVSKLKKIILEEGHKSGSYIYLGATKIYQDLKRLFWWPGMKKYVVGFFYACLTRQKLKIKHQTPSGLMQPLNI